MTGFDPTAPERDTENDAQEHFQDNVVPPEVLTDEPSTEDDDPAEDA